MKRLILSLSIISAISFGIVAQYGTSPVLTATVVSLLYMASVIRFGYVQKEKGLLFDFVGMPGVASVDGSPGIQVISTERDRTIHLNASSKSKWSGKRVVPGYLRLEAVITNNNNELKFFTYTGDASSVYPTEQRLDRNDAFLVSEYSVFLLKQDVANKKTNGMLYTYPNITAFGAAAAADLMAIYTSGKLNIEINKVRHIPDLDAMRFLNIPETQQSGATNYDQYNRMLAFHPATPQFEIDGSGTNNLSLRFETYTGFAGASAVAGTEHRVVLYFRGFYIAGGSVKEIASESI